MAGWYLGKPLYGIRNTQKEQERRRNNPTGRMYGKMVHDAGQQQTVEQQRKVIFVRCQLAR